MKPHKGRIFVHKEWPCPGYGLGYAYICTFVDHPEFSGKTGNTSWVIKDDRDLPRHKNDGYEIETKNSRYTVVPDLSPSNRETTTLH